MTGQDILRESQVFILQVAKDLNVAELPGFGVKPKNMIHLSAVEFKEMAKTAAYLAFALCSERVGNPYSVCTTDGELNQDFCKAAAFGSPAATSFREAVLNNIKLENTSETLERDIKIYDLGLYILCRLHEIEPKACKEFGFFLSFL